MDDDRIGSLVGKSGARQRSALQSILRIGCRVLIGDLGKREPLHADAESRTVHHREHCVDAAILLADQPTDCPVVVHHAGGIAMDPHLLFGRAAGNAVRRPSEPSAAGNILGTTNSETPRMPGCAPSMRASTRCTMFSDRSCSPPEMKILLPVSR